MISQASIEIEAPIEEVFRASTEEIPQWSSIVIVDEVIQETPEGVGTTFRTVTEERGRRMEFAGTVTASDPPRRHAAVLKGKQFDIDVECTFEKLSHGTRVTQRSIVQGKGLMRVFLFLCGWLMNKSGCKATEQELLGLKAWCERSQ